MTVEELCKNIRDEIIRWKDINRNGCNDPFYSDGWNMNFRAKRNTASGKNGFNQKRIRREYEVYKQCKIWRAG